MTNVAKRELSSLPALSDSVALAASPGDPDAQLVKLWLHGRSSQTVRAYRGEIARFRAFCPQRLTLLTLGEIQDYQRDLEGRGLAPASQKRALAAIKSLLAFGARLGVLPVDVGRPVRLPKVPDDLAERILSEEDVRALIGAARTPRNRLLLLLLYYSGCRISEAVGLRWRNCQARVVKGEPTGQVSLFGKGGKSRVVLLPAAVWAALTSARAGNGSAEPVFPGYRGQPLTAKQGWRIVKAAASQAGLGERVSPHFLRHSSASHALHAGATVDLVAKTLGHSSIAVTSRYLHAAPDDASGRYLPTL